MKWFEPIIIVVAILMVLIPIVTHFVKKKKGTLKCECGHLQSECTGKCESCNSHNKTKKNKTLKYILNVEGMRCGMCETHINDVIRNNIDVKRVKSFRRTNTVIIESYTIINVVYVKKLINDSGYTVSSISLV